MTLEELGTLIASDLGPVVIGIFIIRHLIKKNDRLEDELRENQALVLDLVTKTTEVVATATHVISEFTHKEGGGNE